jgi:hypothetical protein
MTELAKRNKTSIFEEIKKDPKFKAERSADWFKSKIKDLAPMAPVDRANLIAQTRESQSNRLLPGTLTFFAYDPKYKETLPYYDKFPLSFIIGIDRFGFTGLNFHYLSIPMRIRLYDAMYVMAKQSLNKTTQQALVLNWKLLSNFARFPAAAPAVKKYLFGHVQSKFIKIPLEDWKTAILLENAEFKKVSASTVRSISTKIAANALKGQE